MQTAENRKVSGAGSIKQDTGNSLTGGKREELHFHYSREERLKKLRMKKEVKRPRILANRRIRSLIIIFVDLLLVGLAIYLLNKPVNLYLKESDGGYDRHYPSESNRCSDVLSTGCSGCCSSAREK
jgi:hypothetical protein